MKATAIAPSNIAFIKYWGKSNEKLTIPTNNSISMNLSNLLTTTTVEFNKQILEDEVIIDDQKIDKQTDKVSKHLDRIRLLAHIQMKAKVISKNNFPSGTGLSSSASGFAALSLAAAKAADLRVSEKELTILARQGSGSACRSIPDGFVEWYAGEDSDSSFAESIYPANYWNICDVVAVVSKEKKDVSTTKGHTYANTSSFFVTRQQNINEKIRELKHALAEKKFTKFGKLVEAEALELHAIYLTSQPSLIYFTPESLLVIKAVKQWRDEGLAVYFTLNTGQDVHIICEEKNAEKVQEKLRVLSVVKNIIINKPTIGARISENHLF